jgi:hypothetical protein
MSVRVIASGLHFCIRVGGDRHRSLRIGRLAAMATEGSPVPGAIVIGELVRLREKLAWRMAAQSGRRTWLFEAPASQTFL